MNVGGNFNNCEQEKQFFKESKFHWNLWSNIISIITTKSKIFLNAYISLYYLYNGISYENTGEAHDHKTDKADFYVWFAENSLVTL